MKHTYLIFYRIRKGKTDEHKSIEADYTPTKIISINELPKIIELLLTHHPEHKIDITGITYLRSQEE